jgi:hypothetical protein
MTKTIVDGVTRDMTSAEQAVFDGYQLADAEFAAKELDLLILVVVRACASYDSAVYLVCVLCGRCALM